MYQKSFVYLYKRINIKKIMKISQKQLEKLLMEYQYTTLKELSQKYQISTQTIRSYINKYGQRRGRLDKQVNYNVFKNLKDNQVQYWLGYLASDGSIFEDRVLLSQKLEDKDVIEKFNKFLNINKELTIKYHKKFGKKYPYVNTSFRNKEITNFLIDLGITYNKSFTLKMNMPITFDFLRGVIDGDGSISVKNGNTKNRIRIFTVSEQFHNQIINFLNDNNIDCKSYKSKKGILDIHIHKKEALLKLIDNLYYDNCVSMARKHRNATQIRNNLMKTP